MLVQVVQGSSPDLFLFCFVSKSCCFTVDGKVASLDDFKMIDAQMAEEIIQTLQLLLGAKQPQDETKPPLHGQDSHVPTALTCSHMFSTVKFVSFFVFLCVWYVFGRENEPVLAGSWCRPRSCDKPWQRPMVPVVPMVPARKLGLVSSCSSAGATENARKRCPLPPFYPIL